MGRAEGGEEMEVAFSTGVVNRVRVTVKTPFVPRRTNMAVMVVPMEK